jgi:glycolate oxidase iron-sulfur subunit
MNESSLCCGSAGIYNVTQPEMAERLQKRKVANALAVDPEIIVTANPGCALQLRNGLRAAGRDDVLVKHVVELLDEAYRD